MLDGRARGVEQVDETGATFLAVYEATVFWAPGDAHRKTFIVHFNRFDDGALILGQESTSTPGRVS